jgi:glycine reductase
MAKEVERAGIPSAQITTMTPVALAVGSNRVIPGAGILHPVGNPEMSSDSEKRLRLSIVKMALNALHTELKEQKLFPCP